MTERTLSHYKVFDELSRGGMGIVYRAVDTKLDREVALKLLPPELVADGEYLYFSWYEDIGDLWVMDVVQN